MASASSTVSSKGVERATADKLLTRLPTLPSEDSPAMKSTKSFSLFPNLTPELRIQIWRSYLQTPRLITISAHPSSSFNPTSTIAPTNTTQTFHIARHAPSPLLSVNSEARYEALTHFSKSPPQETVVRHGVPYHTQHKSSTKGFYRNPGDDVVYLKGCYYDSRWFRGVGVVGREVVESLSVLLSLSLDPSSESGIEGERGDSREDIGIRGSVPLVGRIKTLALDQAFLSDETLFGRPEVSPAMVYLMRDLKDLERLIIVRTEGEYTEVEEIESRIEDTRRKLVWQCGLWGYGEEMEELRGWKCPVLNVMGREELGEMCGEWDEPGMRSI